MQCLNQLYLKGMIWHERLKTMETAKTTGKKKHENQGVMQEEPGTE
jgi:hypothetical protein